VALRTSSSTICHTWNKEVDAGGVFGEGVAAEEELAGLLSLADGDIEGRLPGGIALVPVGGEQGGSANCADPGWVVQCGDLVDDETGTCADEELGDWEVAIQDGVEKWQIAAERKRGTGLSMFWSVWKSSRS
jgi:hypothetical protein